MLRECSRTNAFTPSNDPFTASRTAPFSTGWLGPVGVISNPAFPSSQLIAPHSPRRSGETMQTWLGANDWHRVQE